MTARRAPQQIAPTVHAHILTSSSLVFKMPAVSLTRYYPPPPLYQDPDTPTWDFAHFPIDEEERRRYCINLKALKVHAMGDPLYVGRVLTPHVEIDAITPPPPNARPLPVFALNDGSFKLRIAKLIHPFRGGKQRSHIWLVDVLGIDDEKSYGQAAMKIIQQSLYGDPFTVEGHLALDKLESALELAATEDMAYTRCKELQGIHIPYCFGFYKVYLVQVILEARYLPACVLQFPMPHGEDAYVFLLEYIPGENLFTWMNSQPHVGLLNINRPTVADSLKEAEELVSNFHIESHTRYSPVRVSQA